MKISIKSLRKIIRNEVFKKDFHFKGLLESIGDENLAVYLHFSGAGEPIATLYDPGEFLEHQNKILNYNFINKIHVTVKIP